MSAEDKEVGAVSARGDATEEYSFDALAKGLASGTISRRKALKLVGSAILGAGVLGLFPKPAEAITPRCSFGVGCDRRCTNTGGRDCRCVRITERTSSGRRRRRCVRPCCSNQGCSRSSDCGSGEVCMYTACCGGIHGVCVTLCTEPRPDYCDRATAQSDTTTTQQAQVWDDQAP